MTATAPFQPVTLRWTINGTLFGFLLTWVDMFIEWRDVRFADWSGSGITYNLGMFGGAMLIFALIGAIAGAVRDYPARRAGLLATPADALTAAENRFEYAQNLGVAGRLGQVLYWAGIGTGMVLAGGALATLIFGGVHEGPLMFAAFLGAAAGASVLVGIALRYILAGPKPHPIRPSHPAAKSNPIWKQVLSVVFVALLIASGRWMFDQFRNQQPGLWGASRTSFMKGVIATCEPTQAQSPDNKGITTDEVRNFCRCFADAMADGVSLNEVHAVANVSKDRRQAQFQARYAPLIERATNDCAIAHVQQR
jgi:hypothetical protein